MYACHQVFRWMHERLAPRRITLGLHFLSIDDKNCFSFQNPLCLSTHLDLFARRFPEKVFGFTEIDVGIHVLPEVHDRQGPVDRRLFYNTVNVESVLRNKFEDPQHHCTLYTYPKLFSQSLAGSKLFFSNRAGRCASPEAIRIKSYNMSLERSAKRANNVRLLSLRRSLMLCDVHSFHM
jgi:hypothetical protein